MNLPVRTQIAGFPSNNKLGCISKKMDTRKGSPRIEIFSLTQSPKTMDIKLHTAQADRSTEIIWINNCCVLII